jgi:hypothetical protein
VPRSVKRLCFGAATADRAHRSAGVATGDNRVRSVHDRRRPRLMAEDELAEVPSPDFSRIECS